MGSEMCIRDSHLGNPRCRTVLAPPPSATPRAVLGHSVAYRHRTLARRGPRLRSGRTTRHVNLCLGDGQTGRDAAGSRPRTDRSTQFPSVGRRDRLRRSVRTHRRPLLNTEVDQRKAIGVWTGSDWTRSDPVSENIGSRAQPGRSPSCTRTVVTPLRDAQDRQTVIACPSGDDAARPFVYRQHELSARDRMAS